MKPMATLQTRDDELEDDTIPLLEIPVFVDEPSTPFPLVEKPITLGDEDIIEVCSPE